MKPLKLGFRVDDLGLRDHAALAQWAQAAQFRFGDRDHLLDLAGTLRDRCAVCQRQGRLDRSQDVAFSNLLSQSWQTLLWRDDAPAVDALDQAAAVRIGDDPSDEDGRLRDRLRLRDDRTYIQ